MSNLSALGGHASETSIPRQANYKSGPNQWGYFVDTPSTWSIGSPSSAIFPPLQLTTKRFW